jgi:2-iminobutanoate/2-iminopropanoate deaminase
MHTFTRLGYWQEPIDSSVAQPAACPIADGLKSQGYDLVLRGNYLRSSQMQKQIIRTSEAPGSALFSQAVRIGPTIYVSGIVGIDPKSNQLAGSTIQEQTRQALVNCENILRAGGATLKNVVDVHVLLARPSDFAGLNEAYAKFFTDDPPARAVGKLGVEIPNVLVSIKLTAVLSD